ncbi:hypothetical protein BMS3Abin03_02974 [bacterium BMS3Abin03]|nr:hypothetical protein BMS3Abin03_02974 [bacterium BMS3Abin03]
MDLIRQYIVQSLAAASNNLRLTSYQLEVVALLRETILNSEDVADNIDRMKKITPLSTLAIRLGEIYNYLTQSPVDFLKFSDDFIKHSQNLIKDLNHLLETDSTNELKNALRKLRNEEQLPEESGKEINVDLSNIKTDSEQLIVKDKTVENGLENRIDTEAEVEKTEPFFEERVKDYETLILKPVKPIDNLLNKLASEDVSYEDLTRFAEIMRINGEISERNGFEILSNMHKIIAASLLLIKSRELMPGKEIIDSIRSCLIVIVAVVRGKDVDITKYLNKAEDFGREINAINNMGVN